jgi:hypothetical protein
LFANTDYIIRHPNVKKTIKAIALDSRNKWPYPESEIEALTASTDTTSPKFNPFYIKLSKSAKRRAKCYYLLYQG